MYIVIGAVVHVDVLLLLLLCVFVYVCGCIACLCVCVCTFVCVCVSVCVCRGGWEKYKRCIECTHPVFLCVVLSEYCEYSIY